MDNSTPIELQCFDRCSANWRDTKDQCVVVTPSKMVTPLVVSWVVEAYNSLIGRIKAFRLVVFVVVTTLTGQGEIIQGCCATFRARNDMLDRKRLRCIFRLAPAVFAAALGTLNHRLALLRRERCIRHT